jgi:hypothetical protein
MLLSGWVYNPKKIIAGRLGKCHPDNLPDPEFIARENADDLEAVLEQVRGMSHH